MLAAYARYLEVERGRSLHTVRAYLGDLAALRTFLRTSAPDADGVLLDARLADLRAWLGEMSRGGAARSSIGRRVASVRTFYDWAQRTGRLTADPALKLAAAKRSRHLPTIVSAPEAAESSVRRRSLRTTGIRERLVTGRWSNCSMPAASASVS